MSGQKTVMWKNQSYVFFRELSGEEADAPMGAIGVPLQPGRSLAVDTSYYSLGTPIYVDAPEIMHATKSGGFQRLMIAHDVGSAIKGPGARRYLFRLRRRSGAPRRHHEATRPFLRAAAGRSGARTRHRERTVKKPSGKAAVKSRHPTTMRFGGKRRRRSSR